MSKVKTIQYGSVAAYATVPARLKEFRERHPRASISTEPKFLDDGSCIFTATIISDLQDEYSARATGTARYSATEISKQKAFEKLETIATGRSLSLLGFLNNGDVASSEEMLEFEGHQQDKLETAIEQVKKAQKRDEFQAILDGLSAAQQKEVTPFIRTRMEELKNASTKAPVS